MRFGLDRMRRLMTALDNPQLRFDSIHVVGTNGKSSTVRMIAAILRRHGLRTGAYLSPHLVSFAERIRVDDADLEPGAFAAAIRAPPAPPSWSTARSPADDRVTQFEAADRRRLLRAGPPGRRGGGDRGRPGRPLRRHQRDPVAGPGADQRRPRAHALARPDDHRHRRARSSTSSSPARRSSSATACTQTPRRWPSRWPPSAARGSSARAPTRACRWARSGAFQRRNFALARAAAEAYLGRLDPAAVAAAAAEVRVPGRLQVVDQRAADAARRRPQPRRAWPRWPSRCPSRSPRAHAGSWRSSRSSTTRTRPACSAALLPACDALVAHRAASNPRALPPADAGVARRPARRPAGRGRPRPRAALARARELAGPGGLVMATGSIYLVADLLRPAGAGRASML